MVTMKYSEISSFQFAQAMQKISSTPTHGAKASAIHKIARALTRAREDISKEYQKQIVEVYGKRDADGKIVRPEGEPNGFEPMEEKQEEFLKTQEEFGANTADLKCDPLTLQMLEDIKISAQDLEALKGLYIGNREDEGKPSLSAVQ